MSNLTRYENRVSNTRNIDRDRDGIIDGDNSRDRPRYEINTGSRSAVITWYKAGFKLAWYYPFTFMFVWIVFWYVIRPMAFTAPVALLRHNPKVLTEKEAGGELNAATNNFVVGIRDFAGNALDNVQENQIKENVDKGDRRPLENKTRVEFVDN